jgi:hypothetical protein
MGPRGQAGSHPAVTAEAVALRPVMLITLLRLQCLGQIALSPPVVALCGGIIQRP